MVSMGSGPTHAPPLRSSSFPKRRDDQFNWKDFNLSWITPQQNRTPQQVPLLKTTFYTLVPCTLSVTTIFLNNLGKKFPSFFKCMSRPLISSLITFSSHKTGNSRSPCRCYPNTETLTGTACFSITQAKEQGLKLWHWQSNRKLQTLLAGTACS